MLNTHFSLKNFRDQLASNEALPQLVALGLVCGLACGLLIAAFRLAIDLPLAFALGTHVEDFESLSLMERFLYPSVGGLILAVIYTHFTLIKNKVGLAHLFERLTYHQGYIPAKNLIAQFITATIALISGQSVGREGPAIYMGASLASILGQYLHVPHNSQRILVACGAAAAISAAFNTPLAGVIFAMEVILLDYTIAGFTPIIVSAVCSSLVTRLIFSGEPVFDTISFDIVSHKEIPWILLLGFIVGLLASIFIKLMLLTKRSITLPLSYRLMLAGLLTGIIAIFYPQVMGTGYDTISATFTGQLSLSLLLGILIAKLILTPIILGLGMPAGMIGPTLIIGALAGAVLGLIGAYLTDLNVSDVGLYAMLGMGSMMAAVLNAPLAALIALLELTFNPHIIFAGMIAIVTANLTTRHIFKMPPVFVALLQAQGFDYRTEPLAQILTRISVAKLMTKKVKLCGEKINVTSALTLVKSDTLWIATHSKGLHTGIFALFDLTRFVDRNIVVDQELIDLQRMPAQRVDIVPLSQRSTVYDALMLMNSKDVDLLCIFDHKNLLIGILTRSQIESYYNTKQ